MVHLRERGVVLDGPLVREPDQRAAVVAERVRDLALRRLGPDARRLHPVRRVLRHVLLHERLLAAMDPDHRERSVLEHRDDPVAHAVEIVDEIALGRVRAVEQRLIEVRQRARRHETRRSCRSSRRDATRSAWPGRPSVDGHDDLPAGAALVQVLDRGGGLGQREGSVDGRSHLSRLDQVPEHDQVGPALLRGEDGQLLTRRTATRAARGATGRIRRASLPSVSPPTIDEPPARGEGRGGGATAGCWPPMSMIRSYRRSDRRSRPAGSR